MLRHHDDVFAVAISGPGSLRDSASAAVRGPSLRWPAHIPHGPAC